MALTIRYASSAGGGAHDGTSEANAWSWAEMLTTANAGQIVNFKGDHTITANSEFTNGGTATNPLKIRAYKTTPGDAYQGRTNLTGALIETNMSVIDVSTFNLNINAKEVIFEGFKFTSAKNTSTMSAPGPNGAIVRCIIQNTGTGTNASALYVDNGKAICFDCDIKLTGVSGGATALFAAASTYVFNCRITGGNGMCIYVSSGALILVAGSVLLKGNNALCQLGLSTDELILYECTLVGGLQGVQTTDGITKRPIIINCLITDNSGYGVNVFDNDIPIFLASNRYDRNTSGVMTGAELYREATDYSAVSGVVTQAGEYVDYTNNDFTPGEFSLAKENASWPYKDIGALQHKTSTGGMLGMRVGGQIYVLKQI